MLVPRVIGRAGVVINRIKKESKANVLIRSHPNGDGDVVITGTPRQVKVGVEAEGHSGTAVLSIAVFRYYVRARGRAV